MQNSVLKFLTLIILCVFTAPTASYCKPSQPLLARADSLFQQKRYTQSFELYQSLFERKQYTPAMLLKMAYIQEGLNRISQSAYYLNLYYLVTQDEAAAVKLEELANKYNLEGYTTGEFDRAFSIYQQNKFLITLGLMTVFVFLMILIAIQRLRFHRKPYVALTLIAILAIISLVHLNFNDFHSKAIVTNSNTYIMDGPSSGASVISIIRDGHRLTVLGKEDVWLRVKWGESEAYIKENNLVTVRL
jgi:hypothetical protein